MKQLKIAKIETLVKLVKQPQTTLQQIIVNIDNNYTIGQIYKKSGEPRPLERPKYKLKLVQKKIKSILDVIELPNNVYGWVNGKSVKSATELHCGMKYIYCFDIKDFFDSIDSKGVYELFCKKLGCSPRISKILTKLTTYNYSLPQGSPCSPVISNLILIESDIKISKYTENNGARYSRFGDDLLISSNKKLDYLESFIINCLEKKGLKLNKNKFRFGQPLKSSVPVLGVNIGSSVTIPQRYRRELKATLHNAKKIGLTSQTENGNFNTKKHLDGKIGYIKIFHPDLASKLSPELSLIPD